LFQPSGQASFRGVQRTAAERGAAVRRVLLITLALNALVAALKLVHGTLTHTLSLRADGFHSLTDGGNNLLGLVGVWWSLRPPDSRHPYGHQKMEVLAASAVGVSLILVAWNVLGHAIERFQHVGPGPQPTLATIVILTTTLLANLFVARYEARRGRELSSAFLESDAAHTRSDVLVTLGVMFTVGAVHLGHAWVDWAFSCAIAVFILVTGVRVVSRNLDYLMDAAQLDEGLVRGIVGRVPGVASSHKIRTRGTPGAIRIDLHIQIARHLNVAQAHEVTHWAIDALKTQLDGVDDVVVHTEPADAAAEYPELPERMREISSGDAASRPGSPDHR
jgi:cation diffusion facilitator family transporter